MWISRGNLNLSSPIYSFQLPLHLSPSCNLFPIGDSHLYDIFQGRNLGGFLNFPSHPTPSSHLRSHSTSNISQNCPSFITSHLRLTAGDFHPSSLQHHDSFQSDLSGFRSLSTLSKRHRWPSLYSIWNLKNNSCHFPNELQTIYPSISSSLFPEEGGCSVIYSQTSWVKILAPLASLSLGVLKYKIGINSPCVINP